MIRRLALAAAALLATAAPLAAAEGGLIRGGEHDSFTRIVMTVEPTTEWSLETAPDRATVRFPGRQLDFGTAGVFDKIPRTRIRAVRVEAAAEGTTIIVDLGCACRVSTAFVGANYLALDVSDRGVPTAVASTPEPAPESETEEERATREAAAVSSAEQVLIRQIERAASQGLVEMSGHEPAGPEGQSATEPRPRAALKPLASPPPAAAPEETAPPPPLAAEAPEADALIAMLRDEQIEATTVFDRDSRRALAALAAADAAPPPACLPDERFDIALWSNGRPLPEQLPALRRRLIGEFDLPDPQGLGDLARLYVRFGFGAEAEALLAGFEGAELEDRSLLVDMARVVDGRAVTPEGPLAIAESCPGRHGLWLALGGAAPAFRDAEAFAAGQAAFEELPTDLRALLGPRFAGRLLDAGHPTEARIIQDTAVRSGDVASPELALVEARLMAAEGRPLEAARAMAALYERNGEGSAEILARLVSLVLEARIPVSERVVTDLRGAALQYRGSDAEPGLRRLLAEVLAARAELAAAVAESRAAAREMPGQAAEFELLAVRLIAAADPASVGDAAYAETALGAGDLVARLPAGDPARITIARQLIALGLPDTALATIAPGLAAGDEAARLLAAEAELGRNDPTAARAALGPLAGVAPAQLRARSFALSGAWDEARAALVREGLTAEAAAYAWPSGDWPAAQAATDDAARRAMASYMSVRSGEAPAPPPAADPAALTPDEAFQQPLPPLDTPSLGAARRLLSAGDQIGGFVEGVLTAD